MSASSHRQELSNATQAIPKKRARMEPEGGNEVRPLGLDGEPVPVLCGDVRTRPEKARSSHR